MTSIVVEDIEDEEMNQKLTNHLKSTDFFNAEEYPQAEFVITNVAEWQGGQVEEGESGNMVTPTHEITGNLTIKGISKSITFPALVKMDENGMSAYTPQFIVDRTDWDIRFKSRKFFDDLKDNFIFDDIGLKIVLNASMKS
jgi:polyisoprenoid-binding protein YceI